MIQDQHEDREQSLRKLSRRGAAAVAVAGGLVLFGWAFDIAALKGVVPGLATMKANAALAFVLSGLSLCLMTSNTAAVSRRWVGWIARSLALAVAAIGLLTLAEYGTGWDFGMDQVLFTEVRSSGMNLYPGRMAVMTAVNFVLLAAALLAIDVETRAGWRPSHWLVLAVAGNSFLAILGYLYGVDVLYRVAAVTAMALHTAALFVLISLALAFARPTSRFVTTIAGDGAAGIISRRLLPAAILIPPFMGWLRWQGQLAGYYSTAFGLALFAMGNVAVFVSLVWWSARALQRVHEQRAAAVRTSDWQQAMLNSANLTVISTDTQGVIQTFNAGAVSMLGYVAEEVVGRHTPAIIHDPSEVRARAKDLSNALGRLVEPGFETFIARLPDVASDENDWTYIRKDGSRFPVRLSVTALADGEGKITGYLGIGKDISALKVAEAALQASEQRLEGSEAMLRLITDNVPALICYIDRDWRFRFNNAVYSRWLDRPMDEIVGHRLDEVYDAPMCALLEPRLKEAFGGLPVSFEFLAPDSGRAFRGSFIPDYDAANDVAGIYGLINDITEQKEIETRLRQLTEVDVLTGLANRNCFNERLVDAIARSERTGDAMALVFLDVDHFKAINDQFGHSGGDLALQEVARRLCNSVRPSDSVARLAGDEFVIILEPLSIKGDAEVVARRIVSAMKSPFRINGAQSAVSCSLGVAVRRRGEVDGPSLLRRADNMLYRMKEAGRGGCLVED